jgi:hypothetical protein
MKKQSSFSQKLKIYEQPTAMNLNDEAPSSYEVSSVGQEAEEDYFNARLSVGKST